MLKNLVEQKILKKLELSGSILNKIADIELIASLAPFANDDEHLAKRLTAILLSR